MEDGRWVTINGAHVFVKEGQSPMDAFIKQKGGTKEPDLSYQGSTSDIARGTGKTADVVAEEIDKWVREGKNSVLLEESKEAIVQLNKVRGNPNAMITIYRATPGDSINKGDWVFLDKHKADRWSKSLFSNQLKPGYKVITMQVRANQIDWTGKNLEFMYKGVD